MKLWIPEQRNGSKKQTNTTKIEWKHGKCKTFGETVYEFSKCIQKESEFSIWDNGRNLLLPVSLRNESVVYVLGDNDNYELWYLKWAFIMMIRHQVRKATFIFFDNTLKLFIKITSAGSLLKNSVREMAFWLLFKPKFKPSKVYFVFAAYNCNKSKTIDL